MRKATIALLCASALVVIACSSGGSDTAGPGAQGAADDTVAESGDKTIIMEVTGAKKADITYGLNSDQSQANGAKVPWKKTLKSSEALTIGTLVAQNKGDGKITCTIKVNGKVVKTNSSEGEYAVVTCSTDALT
jgi:hypothetical protein